MSTLFVKHFFYIFFQAHDSAMLPFRSNGKTAGPSFLPIIPMAEVSELIIYLFFLFHRCFATPSFTTPRMLCLTAFVEVD